ncbi:MAG: transaldolase, partial [Candidatus Aminicenantes bacterium]|nr:transaldolase [Candidatus Aminicenantes bacterium]
MPQQYFHRVHAETPTRMWINNPTVDDTRRAIAAGAVSCTTNPSFCSKLLQTDPEHIRGLIAQSVKESKDNDAAAEQVYHRASARILELFRPLYDQSRGTMGFVTIQDDPRHDDDAEHIVDVTMRCTKLGPNFMTKIPVIASGISAIEELVARNIPICATEIFAVSQAVHMCEVYERAAKRSGNYPPFYLTHITGIFDQYMAEVVKAEKIGIPPEILRQAGCVIARRPHRGRSAGDLPHRCPNAQRGCGGAPGENPRVPPSLRRGRPGGARICRLRPPHVFQDDVSEWVRPASRCGGGLPHPN